MTDGGVKCVCFSFFLSFLFMILVFVCLVMQNKRNGNGDEVAVGQSLTIGTGAPVGRQRNSKKTKSEYSAAVTAAGNGHARVRFIDGHLLLIN